MPDAEMVVPEDNNAEASEDQLIDSEIVTAQNILSLKLLPLTKSLHAKHGLRHGDYQRYRGYCSRRIARLRKALKFVQGDRKRFVKKDMTIEILENAAKTNNDAVSEAKHLQIPLMSCERAWAYAMQLKFEMNTEPRKKYHMINRLRKAAKYAGKLEALCNESSVVDARTKLESRAYVAWLSGSLAFETQAWSQALGSLNQAKNIYEQLSATLSEEEAAIYRQRMEEIIPSLRYCAYNIGDTSARQDLLNMSRGGLQGQELNDLINQTREQQASTLQEVEWRGRKMAVKQEKVRLFLLRAQEFQDELERQEDPVSTEKKIAAFESLLMDCKDAIQVLRDDLIEDPSFRARQQSKEGIVTSSHFLYTYLTFIKCSKTIDRNLVMIEGMRRVLNGEDEQEQGKKPVKPQDLARLYETIIQNLNDLPQLAGLEDDLEFRQEIDSQVGFYKAARCYYIALAFLMNQKWSEAMALFQRATVYANKAKNDKLLPSNLKKEVSILIESIEGRQFMAHANSILEGEEKSTDGVQDISVSDAKKLALIDRLDVFYEDQELSKGKANLAHFPPNFTPIPCKPLFFDLAHEHLTFPSLESKLAPQGQAAGSQAQGSGWLGGWLGWGAKPKK